MNISKRSIIISLAVAAALIGGGTTMLLSRHSTSSKNGGGSGQMQKTPAGSRTGNSAANTSSSPSSQINSGTNAAYTAACAALPLSGAQNILGSSAQPATPIDLGVSPAANTELTSCAYAADGHTAQLTLRSAKGSLGASQNATVFGSEKPADITDVQGYGQSAYWNPSTGHFAILSHNDWYTIVTSQGTQASAEAAAKQVKGL
jgi:hypothetical protein